jgi:biotin carboxylase
MEVNPRVQVEHTVTEQVREGARGLRLFMIYF